MTRSRPLLYADILFAQLEQELNANRNLLQQLSAYFIVNVLKKGKKSRTWHLILQGPDHAPVISRTAPSSKPHLPTVTFELEDDDLLKLATGGMNGIKAITSKKLKVQGDLQVASQVEQVFKKAGGVERVLSHLRSQGRQPAKL